jgi:hypothetical protein
MHAAQQPRNPWLDQVISKLHQMGLTDTVTMHGDASYSLHAVDPTSFARPPDPEQAYVAGGIVIVSQVPEWRTLPSLVIQIQNGQDMHMDSAFPMELLVLEVELLLTKRMEKPNVVTSDC